MNDWEKTEIHTNVETRSEDCEDSDGGDAEMTLISYV